MFGLLTGIIALLLLGYITVKIIALTFKWLRNQIKERLAKKNTKKVAVADIQQLINECDNTVSMDELDKLADEGYTHFMAEVDYDNQIEGEITVIKDTSDTLDKDVERLLGRKGMVVVEA